MALVGLVVWVLMIGAAIQAGRAWGTAAGLGTMIGLFVVGWFVPWGLFGWIGGLLGYLALAGTSVAIGVRAENAMQRRLEG
ncbi:MAG: hypothetical protein H6733_12865 [Alphaproteobacteria bacterium]|nr:hypothetical protein [Alphaproteobacteria bacterium]